MSNFKMSFGLPVILAAVWFAATAALYVVEDGVGTVIGHVGRDRPAINTAARLHTLGGDGIVVLASGTPDLASRLADDWVYWRTGRVAVTALTDQWPGAVGLAALLALVGAVLFLACRRRRNR